MMNKFLKSFGYAFAGLIYAFKTQLNFKFHCIITVLVLLLGFFTKLNNNEWLWLIAAIAMVMVLELINTAIEILVDLISPEQHPKAGAIKDIVAAAVLIGAIAALTIGLIIFVPKYFY